MKNRKPPIDMKGPKHFDLEKALMAFTLRLIGEILGFISVPIVALTWIGRRLDVHMESKPYLHVAAILIAFVVSSVTICLKSTDYRAKYELLTDKPSDDGLTARPPPRDDAMS